MTGIHEEATPLPTNEIILSASRPSTPDLESDGSSNSDDQNEPPASPSPTSLPLSELLTFLENPYFDNNPHALDGSLPVELDGVAIIDGLGRPAFKILSLQHVSAHGARSARLWKAANVITHSTLSSSAARKLTDVIEIGSDLISRKRQRTSPNMWKQSLNLFYAD